jgi:hypothetical protein
LRLPAKVRRGVGSFLVLLAVVAAPLLCTHELESERVTVIQREPRHLSVTFHLDEVELLRRLLAPTATHVEFCLSLAAMPDQSFGKALDAAHRRFAASLSVITADGEPLELQSWRWSSQADIRSRVREVAMIAVAGGSDPLHRPVDEIAVDAIARSGFAAVRLVLPSVIADTIVVSYRPQQQRYRPQDAKRGLELTF